MSKIREMISKNLSAIHVNRGRVSQSLASLQNEMNRLFEHFYHGMEVRMTDWDMLSASFPAINVTETGAVFSVQAVLSGIDAKDLRVATVGGILTIAGESHDEMSEQSNEKTCSFLLREIPPGAFARTVTPPDTADCEMAAAEFKNGVLTVTVPKTAAAQEKRHKIDVKQAA